MKILMALKNPPAALLTLLEGHQVDKAEESDSLTERVSRGNYHLILAEFEAAEIISDIKSADPRAEVVLIGGDGEEGVEAVKGGAYACVKTAGDTERLGAIVADLASMAEMRADLASIERQTR